MNEQKNKSTSVKSKPCKKKIKHIRASAIKPEAIDWLWPYVFALGKYSLIAGEGGLGKSQLAIFIAAIISTEGTWPHSTVCARKGRVIILSAEDDEATTIVPRLISAGANLDLIEIVTAVEFESPDEDANERHFDLTKDIDVLDTLLAEYPETSLVLIDPITAYLGNINSNNNSDVRRVLAPLSKLAQKYNVAIGCITHLNKSDTSSAKSRVNGSVAFLNAARSSFLVAEDPSNPNERVFVELKNNLSHLNFGYKFIIEETKISDSDITTSRIKWLDETTTITAADILSSIKTKPKNSRAEKIAEDFLKDELSNGPIQSVTIKSMAEQAGIATRTL